MGRAVGGSPKLRIDDLVSSRYISKEWHIGIVKKVEDDNILVKWITTDDQKEEECDVGCLDLATKVSLETLARVQLFKSRVHLESGERVKKVLDEYFYNNYKT